MEYNVPSTSQLTSFIKSSWIVGILNCELRIADFTLLISNSSYEQLEAFPRPQKRQTSLECANLLALWSAARRENGKLKYLCGHDTQDTRGQSANKLAHCKIVAHRKR